MENEETMNPELEGELNLPEMALEYPVDCYANRELSWLKFNERVLEEANDTHNPLCERLSFLSIFQSNLDEYFMVRVGTLFDQRKTTIRDNKTGMSAKEQLSAVLSRVRELLKAKDRTYRSLMKELRPYRIEVLKYDDLSGKEKRNVEHIFMTEILPLLSPQIIAPKQPFPFLNNKDIYAVVLLGTKNDRRQLGIVPCSNPVLRRLIPVSQDTGRYMLVEDVVAQFASRIFDRYRVISSSLVRVVRNADISIDDQWSDVETKHKDYRKAMEKMIQTRRKLRPIRMEFGGTIDANVVSLLCGYMKLPKKQAFYSAAPLDLSFLGQVLSMLSDNRELFYVRRTPQASPTVSEMERVTDQILRKDIFLTYPYESMRPFLRLLNEAGQDPDVVSIRITLYRMAKNSQIVESLIQAAENGKEVLVLVELRARFDEENNVEHSRELENAGCRVIYGIDNIKIHSKLCVITRKSGEEIEYITQIGTGNYNEKTARLYTDYCLMTANRDIGEEAAQVFTSLALGQVVEHTDTLLVAPESLQMKLVDKIDRQIALAKAGRPAYVGFKLNALTDRLLIDKLIDASRAGVKVQMLIRGICCLVTGVPGYTDNIEVYSIVGRYLEHGRLYIFGCEGSEEVYISSADLMTRNTTRRVEVGAPLLDPEIRARALNIFRTMLRDNVKLRCQQDDGNYIHVECPDEEPFCVQEFFAAQSYRACGNRLPEENGVPQPAGDVNETPAEPAEELPNPVDVLAEVPGADEPELPEGEVADDLPAPAVTEESPVMPVTVITPEPVSEAPEQKSKPAEEKLSAPKPSVKPAVPVKAAAEAAKKTAAAGRKALDKLLTGIFRKK